jgi:hypothetical protein
MRLTTNLRTKYLHTLCHDIGSLALDNLVERGRGREAQRCIATEKTRALHIEYVWPEASSSAR